MAIQENIMSISRIAVLGSLELAKEILVIWPDSPIILCSGFTETYTEAAKGYRY